jgi:Mg-chelatase subunit ChlI
MNGNLEVIEALLRAGAKWDYTDDESRVPEAFIVDDETLAGYKRLVEEEKERKAEKERKEQEERERKEKEEKEKEENEKSNQQSGEGEGGNNVDGEIKSGEEKNEDSNDSHRETQEEETVAVSYTTCELSTCNPRAMMLIFFSSIHRRLHQVQNHRSTRAHPLSCLCSPPARTWLGRP